MRLRTFILGLTLLVTASLAPAQYRNTAPAGDSHEYIRSQSGVGLHNFRGLLDPSRMRMSHSVQFGYVTAGGRSLSQGLYMNRMDYQISKPLSLTTHLGYRFNPTGPAEWNPGVGNGNFVGGADLNWRPSANTLFQFSVYRGYHPDPYYSQFGWGPYDYSRSYFGRP